jgi:cell division protein FtsB
MFECKQIKSLVSAQRRGIARLESYKIPNIQGGDNLYVAHRLSFLIWLHSNISDFHSHLESYKIRHIQGDEGLSSAQWLSSFLWRIMAWLGYAVWALSVNPLWQDGVQKDMQISARGTTSNTLNSITTLQQYVVAINQPNGKCRYKKSLI